MDLVWTPASLSFDPCSPRLIIVLFCQGRVLDTIAKFFFAFVSDVGDANTSRVILAGMSTCRVFQVSRYHGTKRPTNAGVNGKCDRTSSWSFTRRTSGCASGQRSGTGLFVACSAFSYFRTFFAIELCVKDNTSST